MGEFAMMTDEERVAAVIGILKDKMVHVSDHALVHHKVAILRDAGTNNKEFRELTGEIAMLLLYDAARDLPLDEVEVTTGMNVAMKAQMLRNHKTMLAAILRASLGMVEAMLKLLPTAKVGHIGMYRDPETKAPEEYYFKIPEDAAEREIFIADPMLATGGSAIDAITRLKEKGCQNMHFMCILAAPEGVVALRKAHPDVDIYIGELDERLDENAYILPGLGDAGDRLFGTK